MGTAQSDPFKEEVLELIPSTINEKINWAVKIPNPAWNVLVMKYAQTRFTDHSNQVKAAMIGNIRGIKG